ncbi:MAG: hypothetical protein MUC52_00060 [Candidatus Omnitrophica bacterium]|jgi:hypothetical protein|nr:hypothetical protein [Candidatus Omnitrophota bacterium]
MSAGKYIFVIAVAACALLTGTAVSRAQENLEPQWLWGEVETVNAQAKTLQVKYLDYDTDIEKELTLATDEKTKYENVKGLEEIKPQDTISVDYVIGSDGGNLAVDISVEKLEDMDAVDIPEPEIEKEKVGTAPAASEETKQ